MEVIDGEGGSEEPKGNRLLKGYNSAEIAGLTLCLIVVLFLGAALIILGVGALKWLGNHVL